METGLISKKVAQDALERSLISKTSPEEELVKAGEISKDDVRKAQAHTLGIPFVDLRNKSVDFLVLSLIPEPIARGHNIVAFNRSENEVEVATLDLKSLSSIKFLEDKLGLKILPRLSSTDSIKSALIKYQQGLKSEFGDDIKNEILIIREIISNNTFSNDEIVESLPAVRIVDMIFKHALAQDVTDIHIEPREKEVMVRYRIDGILHDALSFPADVWSIIGNRLKKLARFGKSDNTYSGFKIEMNKDVVSIKISISQNHSGEKMVISLLHEDSSQNTFDMIGFYGTPLDRIHDVLKLSKGMVIVSGPDKSNVIKTIYTLIDALNTPRITISTVERHIERIINRVNQSVINPDQGITFVAALLAALRQDPDVIMVSEIENIETLDLLAGAVATGKFVIGGMIANSATQSIQKMIQIGVETNVLASTLSVIISQKTVRKLANQNDRKNLSKEELSTLGKVVDLDRMLKLLRNERIIAPNDNWEKVMFGFAERSMRETMDPIAYKGFIDIHEVMIMSSSVGDLISRGAQTPEIEKMAKKEGMITLLEDGILAAARGLTTIEEVLRSIAD